MHPVYALEPLPDPVSASLFLAGPTPREASTPSWRPEALSILAGLGYRGAVLIPEPRSGEWRHSYVDQTSWEVEMRARADLITFWVPRELGRMPAFTTNVEFGEDYDGCRCLYGRPADAPKNRYLDVRWNAVAGQAPLDSLADLLAESVRILGDGALRAGAEREVPLGVWRSPAFRRWYDALLADGRTLQAFHLHHVLPAGTRHPSAPLRAFLAEAVVAGGDGGQERHTILAEPDAITLLSPLP
jgi:hypothetical protein